MKINYIKIVLFTLPLIIVVSLILLVDPYNLWHTGAKYDIDKYKIGYAYDHGHRYKIFSFLNNPKEKIILGASEINVIDEHNIPEDGWQSLSFGGAQLEETIDLFWYVANNYKLSNVILAPEFIKYYNAIIGSDISYYNWNTTQSYNAIDLFYNKTEAMLDKYTILSTCDHLANYLFNTKSKSSPDMTKEAFWKHQMDYAMTQFAYSVDANKKQALLSSLDSIAIYAKNQGIKMTIVLPIQHTDLILLEYSDTIYPIYRDYLSHLIKIFGRVYYFDYPNNVSSNPDKFSDPFHYIDSDLYLNTLWGDSKISELILLQNDTDICKIDSIRQTFIQK